MNRSLRTKLEQLNPQTLSKLEPVGFDSNRMRRALPPLQTLIAFEASARLQSFTLAAAELNLTQPAVSQQVKLLENRLKLELFRRSNNQIILTEQGEQFARAVGDALDKLGESVMDLEPESGRTTLTVSLLPSFASTWFASRTHRFLEQNPTIDLVTLSTVAVTGFGQEDADVAIRWGQGGAENLYEERLFGENHFLVASADCVKDLNSITCLDDLHNMPFFHDTNHTEWRTVIEQNGGKPEDFENGAYFGDSSATLNAIISSGGFGVVRDIIAGHLLKSGQLIRLPFKPVKGPLSYFFVCPEGRIEQQRVQTFLSWLREESKTA